MKILDHYVPAPVPEQRETISVVICAYNIAEYLERGVKSVCGQTYRKLDIILVDDGSTDGTEKICDRLAEKDERIRVIHKENGGLSDARNAGMKKAKGELVAFLDGDDWIDPCMYETMYASMCDLDADLSVCRYRQVHREYTLDGSTDRAVCFEGQEALECYVCEEKEYAIQNAAWNKLYRRELLQDLWFPVGKLYEDILFTTKVFARTKRCVYLDTAFYNYIIDREGSIMNAQLGERTFTDHIPAYREKTKFLAKLGRQDLAEIHDYFFYKRLFLFYNSLREAGSAQQQQYRERLAAILREDGQRVCEVFRCREALPKEYRRAKIFLKSEKLYWILVQGDVKIIIPMKVLVKRMLRRGKNGNRT